MRIAICDDNAVCREQAERLTREYIRNSILPIHLSVYERATDLLEDVQRTGSFDIYILDIMMPRLNGIELGMKLRDQDSDCKIIYLTSSPDFAIAAYKTRASEYLLKPVREAELTAALNDAIAHLNIKREKSIVVKTNQGSVKLAFNSIIYAELKKKDIHYYLTNGKEIESTAIRTGFAEAVQELLRDNRFFMCSASVMVNLYHIHLVNNDTVLFQNGQTLYLSRRAIRELRSTWADFWMNKEGSL